MNKSQHPQKIRLMNHKGDEVIASFDRTKPETIQVAQNDLTAFLTDCVTRYGSKPPVWAKRSGQLDFEPFSGDLAEVDEVLLQYPIVGG